MNVITPVAGPGNQDAEEPVRPAGDRRWAAVAVGATAVCALLVAHRIGDHGFWYDEGATIGTVDRPLGDALWRIANWELNQSPYHLLALGWLRLVDGEAAMRALSGIFAVAAVPLSFALGRRLVGARAGAITAVLVAVHPFAVQWGQQLRGYSLVLVLSLLSTLLLVRTVEEPSTERALAYGVVAAVSVYAQMFSALLIGAHALAVLLTVRPLPRRAIAVAGAVAAVLLVPMAEFFVNRQGDPLDWVDRADRHRVLGTAEALAGGGPAQLWAYGLVGLAGAVVLLRRVLTAEEPTARLRALLPVVVLIGPPVATVVLSVTAKPLVEARFLMVVLPGVVLVAAAAVDAALDRHRALGAAALGALVVVSALGLRDWYDREPFDQWREAVREVAATAEAGDVVLTSPSRAVHVARHYADDLEVPATVGVPEDLAAADPRAVYELVRFEDEPPPASELAPEIAAWLHQRYQVVDERRFAGVLVRRHVRR